MPCSGTRATVQKVHKEALEQEEIETGLKTLEPLGGDLDASSHATASFSSFRRKHRRVLQYVQREMGHYI